MTSSVREALVEAARKAVEAKNTPPAPVAAVLHQTVDDWSKDDPAHADAKPQRTTKEKTVQVHTPAKTAAPTKEHLFKETCGVSRATFEYTRDHPEKTHAQIVQDLVAKGFKLTSVDSLLYQMVSKGLLRRTNNGRYEATQKEYVSLRATKVLRNIKTRTKKRQGKTVAKKAPVKAAVVAPVKPAPVPQVPALQTMSSSQIMEQLTVMQARELYAKLKEVFGGQA